MCSFTVTVFLSVFQLIPVSPFHISDLGGGPLASGLFLGFLTFASAWSAPFTGAYADRIGRRRTLVLASLGLAGLLRQLRVHRQLPAAARPRARARHRVVVAAVGVGGVHDRRAAGRRAGRKGSRTGAWRRSSRWPSRRASASGCIATAGRGSASARRRSISRWPASRGGWKTTRRPHALHTPTPPRPTRPAAPGSSAASCCSRCRCFSTPTGTAPSAASARCTPMRSASSRRRSTSRRWRW